MCARILCLLHARDNKQESMKHVWLYGGACKNVVTKSEIMKKFGCSVGWYRGTKIVGPYGGARKLCLKKLKIVKMYGGVKLRGSIVDQKLWGRTVGLENCV